MPDAFAALVGRRPPRDVVRLAADPADADRLRVASAKVAAAAGTDDRQDAVDELEALRAEIVTVAFTLEAIGATVADEIGNQHLADDTNGYDTTTYGPALLAAMVRRVEFSNGSADPIDRLTEAQVATLWAGPLTEGDRDLLLASALALNRRGSGVGDLGKG